MNISLRGLFYLLLLALFPLALSAQAGGVTVKGNWVNPTLPSHTFGEYNEVWGIEVNGHEYGIIGSVRGTHFIDLESNPLEEVFFIAGRDSVGNNIHRDFHHFGNYLYAVCDEGQSSLQIMDFSDLPNSVKLVYDSDEFIIRSHNIFIDEANARLYTNRTFNWYLSLDDPEKPVQVMMTTSDSEPPSEHDLFVKDNIAYLNCEDQGLWIYDVNDPTDYKLLGAMINYPNQGYNHSGWLNEAGTHYFLCEETTGADIKTIDVTDPADLEIKKRFNVGTPYENLPHNAMVRGNYLYISYYYDGLQVYDISDPEEPFRVAFYDSFDGPNNGFRGAWGIYSLLPSGRVLLSDMTYGLFVLEVTPGNYPITATLNLADDLVFYCDNLEATQLVVTIGEGFGGAVNLDIPNLPTTAGATYSANPAAPGSEVTITISGVTENIDLRLTGDDGLGADFYVDFSIVLESLPEVTPLLEPANGASQIGTSPNFSWDGSFFFTYFLEIALDPNDFEGSLIYSQSIPNAKDFDLPIELISGTYYWRISSSNDCGAAYSEVFEFHTGVVSTIELERANFSIAPNPAKKQFTIELPNNDKGVQVLLLDVQGRLLTSDYLAAGQQQLTWSVDGRSGMYFVQLRGENKVMTKKVVFTP